MDINREAIVENARKVYTKEEIDRESRPLHWWQQLLDLDNDEMDEDTVECLNDYWRRGLYLRFVEPGPSNIFDESEDWDICCVLDGCRYDRFKKFNPFKGKLKKVISCGYNTVTWSVNALKERHSDTIFVSANAWHTRFHGGEKLDDWFFRYERPWKDHWRGDLHTLPPDIVTDIGIELREQYPDKRLILFYLQPHGPFIGGDSGEVLGEFYHWKSHYRGKGKHTPKSGELFSMDRMVELYEGNLKLVLNSLERLFSNVSGKVLVTADHGECLGECGVLWSHKGGWLPSNVEIPWFEMEVK